MRTQALPIHLRVSERLIRQIAAGQLADGARLPPERVLAAELGISVGTLRKALAELAQRGLLRRVQGSGNYVRRGGDGQGIYGQGIYGQGIYGFFRLELHRGGGLPEAVLLDIVRLPPPPEAHFSGAALAHCLRRLRLLDDEAVALEEIWLDAGPFDVGQLSESLYHSYAEVLGLHITRVEDRIGHALVPDWAPEGFGLRAGAVAGHVTRLAWAAPREPVEYSRTWFDNSKVDYVLRSQEDKKS